jgi:hypothetical protein
MVRETIKTFFPIKSAETAPYTRMVFLSIGNKAFSDEEIRELALPGDRDFSVSYEWPVTIRPGETTQIRLRTKHFKYLSDSEIWSTLYPTMQFDLILRCSIPLRSLGLRTTSSQLVASEYVEPDKGIGNWTVGGPLLPGEAITYWWSADIE